MPTNWQRIEPWIKPHGIDPKLLIRYENAQSF